MTLWPSTRLTELLGLRHPIIQSPMAGSSTNELAAAVSNAGGLGSVACGKLTPEEVGEGIAAMQSFTNRPVNFNFFAHGEPRADPVALARTRDRLAPYFARAGLGAPPGRIEMPAGSFDRRLLAPLLDHPPAVVSFHFGLPASELVAPLREAGVKVLCTATTVAEARRLEQAGVHAIIAQGFEAGGHRGSFTINPDDAGVGLFSLIPQIRDAVSLPVIAAGGIADGRGIAAAFALGADGVQMGTAFLLCPEAAPSPALREAVRTGRDDETRLTLAHSGRPARARRTPYIDAMAEDRSPLPDFPLMYALSAPLSAAAASGGDRDFQFLLYGQSAALAREMPASELVERLAAEAQAALRNLAGT